MLLFEVSQVSILGKDMSPHKEVSLHKGSILSLPIKDV